MFNEDVKAANLPIVIHRSVFLHRFKHLSVNIYLGARLFNVELRRDALRNVIGAEACPEEAFLVVKRYRTRIKSFLFSEERVIFGKHLTRIISATVIPEDLSNSDRDIVMFATQERIVLSFRIKQCDVIVVVELVLCHPWTAEILALSEEIRLASEAIRGLRE